MKKNLPLYLLIALSTGWTEMSCGDDPKINPCAKVKKLNADFLMKEVMPLPRLRGNPHDTLVATDTTFGRNGGIWKSKIQFEAAHDSVSYEWKIGDDPRVWNTKMVTLTFDNVYGSIPIRLIAHWTPNTSCFPGDKGVDTVYHTLTFIDANDNPIFGEFKGYNLSQPADTFRIKITKLIGSNVLLTNINKGCDFSKTNGSNGEAGFNLDAYMYRRYFFSGGIDAYQGGNCLAPEGVLVVSGNGKTVRVDYTRSKSAKEFDARIKEVFIGTRTK